MALVIKDEIATSGGVTSNAFINIQKIVINTDQSIQVSINVYLDQDASIANPASTVIVNGIPKRFGISNIGSPSPLDLIQTDPIYDVCYDEIKLILTEKGYSVADADAGDGPRS